MMARELRVLPDPDPQLSDDVPMTPMSRALIAGILQSS